MVISISDSIVRYIIMINQLKYALDVVESNFVCFKYRKNFLKIIINLLFVFMFVILKYIEFLSNCI